MKIKTLLLLAMFLALVAPTIVSAACSCQYNDCNTMGMNEGMMGQCGGCGDSNPFCCCDCTPEGASGCGPPLFNDCCDSGDSLVCTNNHCCPVGETYNLTSHLCQTPVLPDTCFELGGDTYCANNFAPKTQCCGGPNSGHCEVCCSPEGTYKDCGFCQYCNTTKGKGNYKCSNQPSYSDIKNECPINKACSGTGSCDCVDSGERLFPPCSWPVAPIVKDCVQCKLIMCNDDCNKCPNGCVTYGNPFRTLVYQTCCLADNTPDCIDCCVLEEGEGCNTYKSSNYPNGCCDSDICTSDHCCPAGGTWNFATQRCLSTCAGYEQSCSSIPCCTGYSCTSSHCCASGETWDASSGRCEPTCTVPKLPASTTNYICLDDSHLISEGTPTNGGACGVGCYNFWIGSTKYSQACKVTEQCTHYYFDVPADYGEDKKNCYGCVKNLAACCSSGMVARTDADCKACNSNWYLSGCHCCPKDSSWDGVACRSHVPCYKAVSDPLFCNYRAPDSSYLPEPGWWNTPFNPRCINTALNQACCFVGAGLYGWVIGEDFYLWHETESIIKY